MATAGLGVLSSGGGAMTGPSASSRSGDASSAIENNAAFSVGGSGSQSQSSGSGVFAQPSNVPTYIALGVLGIVVLVMAFKAGK